MANQPDSSDDLIAELAKLMATNAKGDASGNKTQTSPASSTPSPALQGLAGSGAKPAVRIPGLDMPPLSVVPIDTSAKSDAKPSQFDFKPMAPVASQAKPGTSVPTIRIPGMDQPVPAPQAAAPAPAPTQPAPQPAAPPPQAAAAAPKPVTPTVVLPVSAKPSPLVTAPEIKPVERSAPPATPVRPVTTTRVEPQIVPPAALPVEAAKPAAKDEPAERREPAAANSNSGDKPRDQKPAFDPIAALIAADDTDVQARAKPIGKPVQVGASAPKPATVTPVVPLNPRQPEKASPKLSPAAPVTLKPGFGTRPVPPENDKFFVAPVFGASTKAGPPISSPPPAAAEAKSTAPASPRRPGDPMDEIETLIGEAVRVDAEKEKAPLDQPEPVKPVVPPLTTGFAPRRANLKEEPDTSPHSAEAAILAAVAASGSGSDMPRVEPVAGEEPARRKTKYKPKPARRPSSGARQYVGLAVAGTLLVVAGLSLYWVLGMGRGDPANAPLLTADASPVKETPAVIASTEPRSPVLDTMDGVTTADSETLVSRDDTEGESVTDVASVPEVTESGLANRKVRTVTVRPDGTIVESDSAVAGAEALPVDRPDVPEVPGESIEPSDLLTAAAQRVVVDPIAAVIAEQSPLTAPQAAETVAAAEPTAIAPGTEPAAGGEAPLEVAAAETPNQVTALALLPEGATPTPEGVVAPIPKSRPLNRELLDGNPSRSVTAAVDSNNGGLALTAGGQQIDLLAPQQPEPAPAAQVAVATPAPTTDAAAYVQLSAQPSEEAARATARTLSNRFSSLFGGAEAEIHRVDLGTKGIWYRVLVPSNSRAGANSMCLDIKNAGGDCILR